MTKDQWIKAYIGNQDMTADSVAEAEFSYYRYYPIEKIKDDPYLYFLYLQAKELEKRIKQLEENVRD